MSSATRAARRRGFTLVELLIVVVVIAILAVIVTPRLMGATRKAKDSALRANLKHLRNAIAIYQADMGAFPANLTALYDSTGLTPIDSWKGPYLQAEGQVVDSTAIPANPYVSSNTVSDHWSYNATDGTVVPHEPTGNDIFGNAYSSY